MKKYLSVIAAFAAVVSSVSCTKELATEEIVIPQDRVVTFEASLENDEDLTKITFGDTANKKMPVLWSAGDAFKLITTKSQKYYRDTLKKSVTYKDLTDCGNFTTTQDSVTKAYFTGTIPAGAVGSRDGIAIFPSSAYVANSAYVTYNTKGVTSCATGLQSTIPSYQDGTGAKYVIAVAGLVNGTLSKFQCMTSLIKLKVKAGSGVDRIILSCQDTCTYGVAGTMADYYYWKEDGSFGSISAATKVLSNTIEVYRNGEELSGDIYITTRNIKKNATSAKTAGLMELTLRFCKGEQISKAYKWKPGQEYNGSSLISFKDEFDPQFIDPSKLTVIKLSTDSLKKHTLVPSYAGAVQGEKFPWMSGSSTKTYAYYNVSTADTLQQSWFKTERTYTYGGYEWVFGTTDTVTGDSKLGSKGKWGYSGINTYQLRIESKGYIKLPVVSGKKPVAIYCAIDNKDNLVWYRFSKYNTYDSQNFPALVPDSKLYMSKGNSHMVFISGTTNDTPYYLISNGAWMPNKLILYYQ